MTNHVERRLAAVLRKSIAGDAAYIICAQIVGKGAVALITVYMANSLPVQEFTKISYYIITSTFLTSLIGLGLNFPIAIAVSENNDRRTWGQDERLRAVATVALTTTLISAVAAPLYLPFLSSDEAQLSGLYILAGAIAATWAVLLQSALYANRGFRPALPPVVFGTIALVAAAVFAALWRVGTLVVIGFIVNGLINVVWYVVLLVRRGVFSATRLPLSRDPRAIWWTFKVAFPGMGIMLIFATLTWLIGRTLIEHATSIDQFNQLGIGMQWFGLVLFIPLALGQALFPRLIEQAKAGSLSLRTIAVPAVGTFGAVAAAAVIGSFATPLIMMIYGAHYPFTPLFVFTLLMAAAIGGAVTLLGYYIMAARGTGAWFRYNLVSPCVALPWLIMAPPRTALDAAAILCACYASILTVTLGFIFVDRRGAKRGPPSRGERS